MDSLYHPEVKSAQISSPIDPCIYFFQMPTAMAIERIWQGGQIPLWNQNNGCGHPIMANIESGVFSWHHFLFPSSSEYLYNLGIVARILVAALGAYYLARVSGIQPKFATLSALSYSLCPNILREIELSKETWSFPWILLLLTTFGKTRSLKNLILLSLGLGIACATIHPECSFNTIVLGCLLVVLQNCLGRERATKAELLRTSAVSIAWLLLVGICTFCIAAPVLLPFAELMSNSDCHKFDGHTPPAVSLPAFLLALIHPAMGGSTAFLGVICLPLAALAYYKPQRKFFPLLICTPLVISVASLLGPLYPLFSYKPFNFLEPLYLQPICMLLLACLMGAGLQKLAEAKQNKTVLSIFITTCFAVLAVPLVLGGFHVPLDSLDWETDKYAIFWPAWKKDLGIGIGCCLILAINQFQTYRYLRTIEILVLASLASEISISRVSLPTHPSFTYKAVGPIKWLAKNRGRMLAMGRHFIVPNIGMVWEINDFRNFNSLYPARYLDFQSFCGGRLYFATHYRYEDSLTPTIDLASVKYIVSRSPVYSKEDLAQIHGEKVIPIATFEQGLSIAASSINYDQQRHQALCTLKVNCNDDIEKNYKIQFAVLDDKDNEIWCSDDFPLSMRDNQISTSLLVGRWAISKQNTLARPLKLTIRVNNLWSNQPLWPISATRPSSRNNAVIAILDTRSLVHDQANQIDSQKRFKLLEESEDGSRIYENNYALPEAYSIGVHGARFASNKENARKAILEKAFNGRAELILETCATKKDSTEIVSTIKPAQVSRTNANQVEIAANCLEPSYLVLTDTFYPGWRAYLNGTEQELDILRANYLFRAVKIPKGKSIVTFRYQPHSFETGLLLLSLALVILGSIAAYQKVASQHTASAKTVVE